MLPVHLYRTLLWCYPAPFRKEYGAEMLGVFSEQVLEARQSGGVRAEAAVWLHSLVDVLVTAPREHCHVIYQDLRYAVRQLASQPGFAAVAVLSLALGIGANTAIYGLIRSVLFNMLPVRDPQTLVMLTDPSDSGAGIGSQGGERSLLTYTEFQQLRDQVPVFESLMASQSALEPIQARVGAGEPEEIKTRMVSAEYFTTLGVSALRGTHFAPDDHPSAAHAVISDEFWQRRFGGRADVLGTPITIRKGVFTIAGIAPQSFFGETVGERPDVWLPLSLQPLIMPGRDWLHDNVDNVDKVMWLHVFGRLKRGVTAETAQAAANVTFKQGIMAFYGSRVSAEMAKGFLDQRLKVRPAATGASELREQFAEPLAVLLAASAMILLIACANLGNLLLARATARTREMSVRLALGAGPGRLVRQLITESMVLAFAGGIVGIGAAYLLRIGLLALVSDDIRLPAGSDLGTYAFAFALTLIAGLILGLLPALRTLRMDAGPGLKEQGRGMTASAAWLRAGKFVVVAQIALSLPLLVGAGLLVGTFRNLLNADLGYSKEKLMMVRIDVQTAGYEEARRQPLYDRLAEKIRAVPGVRTAAYARNGVFLGGDSGDELIVEGYVPKDGKGVSSRYEYAGPGYFATLGAPILMGREFSDRDHEASKKVCVINENFAKKYFDGRNPMGMRITQVYAKQKNTYEVVGVVRNFRKSGLRGEIEHRFYIPVMQPVNVPNVMTFAVRTTGDPARMTETVRRAILEEDPTLPVTTARPVTELLDNYMVQERLLARLSIAFGVCALLLSAIGLYGVLSYGVARRTNEIGIRKALGAQHSTVIAMILLETGLLLVVGVVLGAGLSAFGLRWITSRLYGLAPTDPVVAGSAITMLAVVGVVAAWIPAYRASRVDPLIALRYE